METENIKRYIQEKWKQGFLPGGNILLYADGSVVYLNYYESYNPNNGERKRYCSPVCDTTIISLEKYDNDIWVKSDIMLNSSLSYKEGFIHGCDGSWGSDGFIVYTDTGNQLIWAYCFEFSNPIVKMELEESLLTCYSDNETVVTIDLDNPVKIKVYVPDTTEERFSLMDYIRGKTDKPDIVFWK
ncbi:MAG: hypothetical protein LUH10_06885 [Tannerellaceae bacterium]|nr:hypothetical protein [Tannerellaceae bacterium]